MFYPSILALLISAVLANGYDVGARNTDSMGKQSVLRGDLRGNMNRLMRSAQVEEHNMDPASSSVVAAKANESITNKRLPEPVNFVINCPDHTHRLDRFRKYMKEAGLTFEVFPCIELTMESFKQAQQDGWFGLHAERGDLSELGVLSVALAHMKLMQLILDRHIPAANIFEDDEIVKGDYKTARKLVLDSLPGDTEFVNLNARDQRGEPVEGADPKLLRMVPGIPRWSNVWLSNYFVSHNGVRKLLPLMKQWNLGPSGDQQIDWFVSEAITRGCKDCDVNAYSYATNALSIHCETSSEKERVNKLGALAARAKYDSQKNGASLLNQVPHVPVDKLCYTGEPEGLTQ